MSSRPLLSATPLIMGFPCVSKFFRSTYHLLIYWSIHSSTYSLTYPLPTHTHPFTQWAMTGPPLVFQCILPIHYLLGIFWGDRIWKACVWNDDCRILCEVVLSPPWGMLRFMMGCLMCVQCTMWSREWGCLEEKVDGQQECVYPVWNYATREFDKEVSFRV